MKKFATELRQYVSAEGVVVEVFDRGELIESFVLAAPPVIISPAPIPKSQPTLNDLVVVVKAANFEFPSLKAVCLAQWILESGRGTSKLFREHNNAGGMKWRKEMEGYAEPIEYQAHDGKDVYCSFASLEAWVRGYWRFIERPVYASWREAAKKGPREYIQFLKVSGYAEDPDYVNKVMALLPEAEKMLDFKQTTLLKILLDPGHSELHAGARSDKGAQEEDLNRLQAQVIAKELLGKAKVDIYDPQSDDLEEIGAKAKDYDVFVSLHHNKYDGKEDPGTEVLYSARNAKASSIALAATLSQAISVALGSKNRGGKSQGLRVLSSAETVCKGPCVLVESYFVNPYGMEEAQARSTKAAQAIAKVLAGH